MAERMKVCVLFGGVSTEHLVSCRSAYNIIKSLREEGHEVFPVGITEEGEWLRFAADPECLLGKAEWTEKARKALQEGLPQPVKASDLRSPQAFLSYHCGGIRPDVVFPAVHGINCEDGVLQGFLEMCDIPYVGAGVLASAAGMDKVFAKMVFAAAGIPQVPYAVSYRGQVREDAAGEAGRLIDKLGLPLFLKPANGGSSVGTAKAENKDELIRALRKVSDYDEKILVETFVKARELEVAVLGNKTPRAASPGEIVKEEDVAYYDYETKYFKSGADAVVPADKHSSRQRSAPIRRSAAGAWPGLTFSARKTGASI